MYHYVRPKNKEYPFFNNLDIGTFKRQLDFFEEEYGFLSKEDYIKAIKNKLNINGAVLTFDDGLKDHYINVLPELKKRNLWGIFYIPSGVFMEREILAVHRVHLLKGKYGAETILNKLTEIIDDTMIDKTKMEVFDKEIYQGISYEESERSLKGLLNYYIKYEYLDGLLDRLMQMFFDEKALFDDIYLTKKEIVELKEAGNIIGSHSVKHKVLSRLSYSDQMKEIKDSFDFIDSVVSQSYKSFCYPYGYKSSYNTDTLEILENLSVDEACIFDNKLQSDNFSNLELSRIDCNNFLNV